MLIDDNVNLNKVILFLQREEDVKEYQKIDKNLNIQLLNTKGLTKTLVEIHKRFNEGEKIVILHDDMKRFYTLVYNKKDIELGKVSRKEFGKARTRRTLQWVINEVYTNMKNYSYGGVSLMNNPYFLGNNVSYDLRLIEGCFYCCINKKDIWCSIKSFQNDIEQCIKFYKEEGGICRVNYVGYEYLPIITKGGQSLNKEERKQKVKMDVDKWVKLYPKYGKMVENKREGYTFKLFRKPKF
tara:strand:- start:4364 stop:5083 length:720 start_codon:yes stop_codon:yes gene_type:complete